LKIDSSALFKFCEKYNLNGVPSNWSLQHRAYS
jgi:hypothetical protein